MIRKDESMHNLNVEFIKRPSLYSLHDMDENLLDEKLLELLHYMITDSLKDGLSNSIDKNLLQHI